MAEFFTNSSIKALAQVIATPVPKSDPLILIDGSDRDIPMFLVHPAGGLSFVYSHLAGRVPGYRMFGLNSPFFGCVQKGYKTVADLASLYLKAITGIHQGDLVLAGWSFGGEVAYEMAVQLERQDVRARQLILIDSVRSEKLQADSDLLARREYLLRNGLDASSAFAQSMLTDMQYHDAISIQYRPEDLQTTQVTLLKASESSSSEIHNGWLSFCKGGFRVVPVVGAHDYLLSEWHIDSLSEGLRLALSSSPRYG